MDWTPYFIGAIIALGSVAVALVMIDAMRRVIKGRTGSIMALWEHMDGLRLSVDKLEARTSTVEKYVDRCQKAHGVIPDESEESS